MLKDKMVPAEIRNLSMTKAAQLADRLLSAEDLKAEFEHGLRRKAFCEFLDIGESTLSTWLQKNERPRMAALSYVLLNAVRALSEELERRDDPAVVDTLNGGFAVVVPPKDGNETGRIVGTAIDRQWATSFAAARSPKTTEILAEAQQLLAERSEHDGDFFDEAAAGLQRIRLLLLEGRSERTLDELMGELNE